MKWQIVKESRPKYCQDTGVRLEDRKEYWIKNDSGMTVAILGQYNVDADVNSRLIASAPDMLAMLKVCADFLNDFDSESIKLAGQVLTLIDEIESSQSNEIKSSKLNDIKLG